MSYASTSSYEQFSNWIPLSLYIYIYKFCMYGYIYIYIYTDNYPSQDAMRLKGPEVVVVAHTPQTNVILVSAGIVCMAGL